MVPLEEEEGWAPSQQSKEVGYLLFEGYLAAFVILFILVICIKHQIKQ